MVAQCNDLEQTSYVDSTQAGRFLELIFNTRPSGAYVTPWTLQDKRSRSFTDLTHASVYAAQQAEQGKDVYVHVAYADKPVKSASKRYEASEVAGITALWLDIDIAHDVHKKKALPETREDARRIACALLEPSVLIDSGHGLQAWYLLDAPLARDDAAPLADDWTHAAQAHARARGYANAVDSTQDLARCLRVAGTMNRKEPDAPVPVRILEVNDVRYSLDQIRAAIASAPSAQPAPAAPHQTPPAPTMDDKRIYELASNAKNGAKYLKLYYADDSGYASPSEADAAYVRILTFYTQDAEQIERLWLASPRGKREKTRDRTDYRQRTIRNALVKQAETGEYYGSAWLDETEEEETPPDALGTDSDGANTKDVAEAIQPRTAAPASAQRTEEPITPEQARKKIFASIGLNIRRVIKRGARDSQYDIEIVASDGSLKTLIVASTSQLRSYKHMADIFYESGLPMSHFTLKRWNTVTKNHLRALETFVHVATPEEEIKEQVLEPV